MGTRLLCYRVAEADEEERQYQRLRSYQFIRQELGISCGILVGPILLSYQVAEAEEEESKGQRALIYHHISQDITTRCVTLAVMIRSIWRRHRGRRLQGLRGGQKIRAPTCADVLIHTGKCIDRIWDPVGARTSICTCRFTYNGQVYDVRLLVEQTAYR